MMKIQYFEELTIWQGSMKLSEEIYRVTSIGELSRDFGLKNQIRRSAISVPSNIAEGFERNSTNELIRFLRISKGSLGELRTQLLIAKNLGYIKNNKVNEMISECLRLSKQTSKLIAYLNLHKHKK